MATIRRAVSFPAAWPRAHIWLRAVLACAGIAIIALAQRAIINNDELSSALTSRRLTRVISDEMHAGNTIAGAIPFFIAGGLIFALNAAVIERQARAATDRRTAPGRSLRLGVAAALATAVAMSAWLNWRLWTDEWQRWYPVVFFGGLGLAGAGFFALDTRSFRPPKVNPWLFVEVVAMLALVGTFMGITARDLGTWRYSAIGDEGTFYTIAGWIRHDPHMNWLSQSAGAFEYHPALGSAWHTLNMMIFGWTLFGWQMGTMMSIALTLPLFWWLLRELWGWRSALFGTAILGASHYLMAYAHTGYDNVFPIPLTVGALACAVAGLNRRSLALMFIAGVFAGLGFHTFYSSRVTIAIVAAAILLRFRRSEITLATIGPIALGFVMTILPLFASDGWKVISDMEEQSIRNSGYPLGEHLQGNFIRTLFAFHFSRHQLHYTAGQLLDPISVTLATAGVFLCVFQIKDYGSRLALAWYVVAAVTAGLLASYTSVAVSRLHFVLPPAAAFAAIALDRLVLAVANVVDRPRARNVLAAGTLAVIAPILFYVNGRHFFEYSPKFVAGTFETVFMRELLRNDCEDAPLRDVAVMHTPDGLLDGTWYFMNRREERPVQFAPRDLPYSYMPLPAGAPTGCIGIAMNEGQPESDELIPRIRAAGDAGTFKYRIESDLSGRSSLLIIPPTDGGAPSDFTAWPLTDFARGDGLDGIVQGAQRGALEPLTQLDFGPASDAPLNEFEPVAVVEVNGEVRGYPLRLLAYHAVANDVVGGVPVAITYDPMSASVMAYERTVDGGTLTLGATGMLRHGNALLYDVESETWWQQLDGRAAVGRHAGQTLRALPVRVVPSVNLRFAYPDAGVLRAPRSDVIDYERNPYLRYEYLTGRPLFEPATDDRLEPMRRVVVIGEGESRVAVPYPDVADGGSIKQVEVDGRDLLLLYDWRVKSSLDDRVIPRSSFVGSLVAFEVKPGVELFPGEIDFGDRETNSRWLSIGRVTDGPRLGETLTPVTVQTGFWFSVSAHYPGIEIAQ